MYSSGLMSTASFDILSPSSNSRLSTPPFWWDQTAFTITYVRIIWVLNNPPQQLMINFRFVPQSWLRRTFPGYLCTLWEPGCQCQVQEQDNCQIFHQNTLQGNVRLTNCEVVGKFTLRRFLSHILHEGFNLEVVICEVGVHKIQSEHCKLNYITYIRTLQGEIQDAVIR